jgi:hypothetical protein
MGQVRVDSGVSSQVPFRGHGPGEVWMEPSFRESQLRCPATTRSFQTLVELPVMLENLPRWGTTGFVVEKVMSPCRPTGLISIPTRCAEQDWFCAD